MFFETNRFGLFKLLLTVGLSVVMVAPAVARDQWQVPRPDAPPTGPVGTGRSGSGNIQPTGGQLPGFTGAGQPPEFGGQPVSMPGFPGGGSGADPGLISAPPGAWQSQVPGLVPPGMAAQGSPVTPLSIPHGKGVMPEFFKSVMGKRLPIGTVITGITENSISSVKSKKGDLFGISLPHGYVSEGEEFIPPGSRILGVVVDSFPAASQRPGMPGRLSISLKTIVFPDGRTSAINAFVDHNPGHDQLKEPKTKLNGFGLGDYGQAFKGMLYSSVAGVSWVHNRAMRGKEFVLAQGVPVSIKLNTTLDVSKMGNPAAPLTGTPGLIGSQAQTGGAVPAMPPAAVPGTPGLMQSQPSGIPGMPPATVLPGGFPGASAVTPGLPQSSAIPGLAPNAVPQAGFSQQGGTFFPTNLQSPDQLPSGGFAPAQSHDDPNSIFKTPIASPHVTTPDPF